MSIPPSFSLYYIKSKNQNRTFSAVSNYLQQGIANLKEENYEEAVDDFKKARELNPESSITAYYLGIAYKKIQNYPEAKTHLKDALTLEPKVKEAVIELSDVLYQLGEMKEALKELEIAESQGMNTPQLTFLKGMILLKLGRESDIVIEENAIIYRGKNYSYAKNDDGTITIEEGPLSGRRFYIANKEAIESFKKAKSLDEKLTASSDFQIAMATIEEGNLNEARDIFKEIIIRDPNADIAQFANQYIDAITKRIKEERPYRLTAGIQYQHDSNVILKPSDVTASAGISGESDSAGIINLRGEYAPRLKAPFGLKTQYSLYQNLHGRLKNYDVQSHSIAIVPNYNLTGGSISLLTSYNLTRVDNLDYLKTLTLSPTYTLFISKTQFALISIKYQDKKYVKAAAGADEDREGSDTNIGISWFYLLFENKGFINGRYEYNRENTKGKNWQYYGNRIGLSLLYPLNISHFLTSLFSPPSEGGEGGGLKEGSGEIKLSLGGEAYSQNFDNTHTVFLKKRGDTTYTFNTMLTYNIYDDVDIQLQYVDIRGVSNISVYGYNKNMVTIGVEGRF